MTLRAREVSGAFEKRTPDPEVTKVFSVIYSWTLIIRTRLFCISLLLTEQELCVGEA